MNFIKCWLIKKMFDFIYPSLCLDVGGFRIDGSNSKEPAIMIDGNKLSFGKGIVIDGGQISICLARHIVNNCHYINNERI